MRILFLGDIFAKPGRRAVSHWLPGFRAEAGLDFVIANGENAAGGKGLTHETAHELFEAGVDALTGGNHSFQHRESYSLFDQDKRVLRPGNLPPGAPGRGLGIYDLTSGGRIAVINLQGRAFMKAHDCPYRIADSLIAEARMETAVIVIDFHAEATSEKVAMAAYVDGRVTAVIGTHTHIPTADARLTAAGTAAITDVGMTGPYDSVIGIESGVVLEQLMSGMPVRHRVAEHGVRICGLMFDAELESGRATNVEPLVLPPWPRGLPPT
ncbi:MAG TPA: TIGR00282 family metallophosphoesterase [Candidatus Sumerlaeota bacterium]|nr:TIGR00282 family metallophosphoesterase [Candidatus Sumerlaeota bacterium]HPK02298.1 TIGR00282 family metallophosphoesterase [Candidatus Sumerlaeota bacterium]